MSSYRTTRKVRFADTDFAGIIFYPRYFEMLNGVVEDWFDEAVGASFGTFIGSYRIGTPMGEIETRFSAPCKLGDLLEFDLTVERVSERTVTLVVTTSSQGVLRVRTRATHVCARLDMAGAASWPDGFREKMATYRAGETTR